jgi:hypothetical protein
MVSLQGLRAGGIFIVPHLLWQRAWVFPSPTKDNSIQLPLRTHKEMGIIYPNPISHGSLFSHLLRHTRGCGWPILTRIVTGLKLGEPCQLGSDISFVVTCTLISLCSHISIDIYLLLWLVYKPYKYFKSSFSTLHYHIVNVKTFFYWEELRNLEITR